jgi:hypothetical protein
MKRRSISVLAAVLFAAAALPAFAQDVDPTGTWDLMFSTQNGPIGAQMVINKDTTGYAGTISSELGTAPIQAAVKGSAVTVGFTMSMSTGDQLGVTFSGTADKDGLKGNVAYGDFAQGTFTATKKQG